MQRLFSVAFAVVVLFALAACAENVTRPMDDANGVTAAISIEDELKPGPMTIAENAEANGFGLLLGAVNYIAQSNPESGIVAGLLNGDQYTVLAPTDDAFLALVGAVEGLLDPEVLANEGPFAAIDDLLGAGTIEAVVSYHVVEGRRSSRSVVPRSGERRIETMLEGATLMVGSDLVVDAVGSDANIVLPDVSASNGVIHAIDAVLLPIDLGL